MYVVVHMYVWFWPTLRIFGDFLPDTPYGMTVYLVIDLLAKNTVYTPYMYGFSYDRVFNDCSAKKFRTYTVRYDRIKTGNFPAKNTV
jgi:hypothetical protein